MLLAVSSGFGFVTRNEILSVVRGTCTYGVTGHVLQALLQANEYT